MGNPFEDIDFGDVEDKQQKPTPHPLNEAAPEQTEINDFIVPKTDDSTSTFVDIDALMEKEFGNFDFKPQTYEQIPSGIYSVVAISLEPVSTESGVKKLVAKFRVTDGEQADNFLSRELVFQYREGEINLNLEKAKQSFYSFFKAIGLDKNDFDSPKAFIGGFDANIKDTILKLKVSYTQSKTSEKKYQNIYVVK